MSKKNAFLAYLLFVIYGKAFFMTQGDAKSSVYIIYLGERQHDDPHLVTDSHYDMLSTVVGSKEVASKLMVYSYKHGFSGFAAKLTKPQAQRLAECPGVIRVIPNSLHKMHTTRSWDYLGLSSNTHNNLLHKSKMGDGIIIGVLDGGFWPESEVFNDKGFGPIPSHWKGVCEFGEQFNATSHCNRKVIGARWFVDGYLMESKNPLNVSGNQEYLSPRDAGGHGTSISSTAAGSPVSNVSYRGLGRGTVRGGAPKARLAIYKVCWTMRVLCADADILKAFDEAIHDGVHVLSISFGYPIPYYPDVDERNAIFTGSFHAVSKGITVVFSAGNDGPLAQTVRNTAPWILTVGASYMDRAFPTRITLGNNHTVLGQAMYTGKEIGFTGLLYPPEGLDPTSSGACQSLSLNSSLVTGKVIICFTSVDGSTEILKASSFVIAAGGAGIIIARNPSVMVVPLSNDFPCVEVDYEVGTQILLYIRSERSPMVRLSASKTQVGISAKVAYFSARGPSSIAPSILKPDITAPGVSILVATSPLDPYAEGGFVTNSGTSMAAPHVSGIVALLKALHPDWSPAAIKSALVTTAWRNDQYGFPIYAEGSPRKLADPFDFGGGIVNPNGAADPGLVFDMGRLDYIQYLCAMGYNPPAISQLAEQSTVCPSKQPSILDVNLPSITIPSLRNSTTLTRTVTNVGPINSVYRSVIECPVGTIVSVKPDVLDFNAMTKAISFTVTVHSMHQINMGYFFGSLTWTDGVHTVKIPISVRSEFYADAY